MEEISRTAKKKPDSRTEKREPRPGAAQRPAPEKGHPERKPARKSRPGGAAEKKGEPRPRAAQRPAPEKGHPERKPARKSRPGDAAGKKGEPRPGAAQRPAPEKGHPERKPVRKSRPGDAAGKKPSSQKRLPGEESRKELSVKKRRRGQRRRRGRMQPVQMAILAVALVVFCISAVALIRIFLEYKQGEDTYQEIEEQFAVQEQTEPETEGGTGEEAAEDRFEPLSIDFQALRAVYPDVYGWIQMPGLDVSYPVVQGPDNDYYLYRMVDGEENNAGSIFVEQSNGAKFQDANTILYGHNMKNGSMFGKLKKYGEEEFYKENPSFYLYTEDGAWQYDIFSVRVVSAVGGSYQISFASEADFEAYIDTAIRTSMYDTGVVPGAGDTLVTLSTCTSSDENRLIVQAVKGQAVR